MANGLVRRRSTGIMAQLNTPAHLSAAGLDESGGIFHSPGKKLTIGFGSSGAG
jgi:hypothetical protein